MANNITAKLTQSVTTTETHPGKATYTSERRHVALAQRKHILELSGPHISTKLFWEYHPLPPGGGAP